MKTYGEIPRLASSLGLSDIEHKTLSDMMKEPLKPNQELADKLAQMIRDEAKEKLDAFYRAIDVQCKAVLKQAKAEGIIVGRLSKAKVAAAGYETCFHDGVGAYIRRNGERVSDIVAMP